MQKYRFIEEKRLLEEIEEHEPIQINVTTSTGGGFGLYIDIHKLIRDHGQSLRERGEWVSTRHFTDCVKDGVWGDDYEELRADSLIPFLQTGKRPSDKEPLLQKHYDRVLRADLLCPITVARCLGINKVVLLDGQHRLMKTIYVEKKDKIFVAIMTQREIANVML